MRYDDDLSELLENLDIESWLDSQAVDYKSTRGRSGPQANLRVCPACGNDKWKVYLNAETGLGNCFACNTRFNKWHLVRAHLGEVSGRQVVEHIRIHVEQRGWMPRRVKSTAVDKPPELVVPTSIPIPYEGRNIKYLANRNIPPEIAAYFHLRYCHQGYFPYWHEGKLRTMDFSQRILIPVFDLDGKMVNFQGRDITGLKIPKYLFPPGLASTGSHLLNGMNVRDTRRVVIGEGAFDVMALKIALDGESQLRDVVPIGTFGKELSWGPGDTQEAKLLQLRQRGLEELTFMWDGEIKATDAAIEAGMRMRALGFKVRIATLPPEKDPNEVAPAVVREAFWRAQALTPASAIQIRMRLRAASPGR